MDVERIEHCMSSRESQVAYSAILGFLLFLGAALLSLVYTNKTPYDFANYRDINVSDMVCSYDKNKDPRELIALLQGAAYGYQHHGEQYAEILNNYGQELLARARRDEVDLEALDTEGDLLHLLALIKEVAAPSTP